MAAPASQGQSSSKQLLDDACLAGWAVHFDASIRRTIQLPITSRSMRVRRKQSSASCGVHTIGSFSLNDVFRTIGRPVSRSNASISAW